MPIRTRKCTHCATQYDVFEIGSRPGFRVYDGQDPATCPRCTSPEWEHVVNLRFHAVGLGGEAGVGRHFPYYDRGLGTYVRDAQHRRHLMEYTPQGVKREQNLIPLDTATDSGLRGTWEDICDWKQAEAEADERVYNEHMAELTEGPNREAYHKVVDHLTEKGVPVAE